MTAAPDLPPITCPSSLVASCAPLLGFEPDNCLVALVLGVPGRAGPVLMRQDLGAPDDGSQISEDLVRGIVGTGGSAVAVVAFIDEADDTPRARQACSSVLDAVQVALEVVGIEVVACLSTNGRVWWSHECAEAGCCSSSRPLDESIRTRVRAEYAFAGYAPLPSRRALVGRVAPDPRGALPVAQRLARIGPAPRSEPWRDREIAFLSRLLVPGESRGDRAGLTPARVARVCRALSDVPVRDTVLLRMIGALDVDAEAWRHVIETLCSGVRRAPVGSVAPVATLLGLVAWMRGDGALANAALDRADADDPEYRLAALGRQVMASGMDPRMWRDAMAGLTEAECRSPRGGLA